MKNDSNRFSRTLLAWYRDNKRELPWRDTRDPYLIWVSETMSTAFPTCGLWPRPTRKR